MLRASKSPMWMACPGSHRASLHRPARPPGPAALEGIRAHHVLEFCLKNNCDPESYEKELDIEMVFHVKQTLEYIRSLNLTVESEASRKLTVTADMVVTGTTDMSIYDPSTRTLRIIDFKYGYTRVDAHKNWQMFIYAMQWMQEFTTIAVDTLIMTILQPRVVSVKNPSTWTVNIANELKAYWAELVEGVQAAYGDATGALTLKPGTHCKYCEAAASCPALRNEAFADVVAEDLNEATKRFNYLETFKEALEIEAIEQINKGHYVPGWSLEHSQGRSNWIDPDTAMVVADAAGFNIRKKVATMTPTQAIQAGMSQDVVDSLSTRGKGSYKLVNKDVLELARKAFSDG